MSQSICLSYTSQLKTLTATSQHQLLLSVPKSCYQQTKLFYDYLLARLILALNH